MTIIYANKSAGNDQVMDAFRPVVVSNWLFTIRGLSAFGMSQTRPSPLSALNTLQRDWSDQKDASSDVQKPVKPLPSPLTVEEKAARLARRRALFSGIVDDSSPASSIKRSSSPGAD